MIEKKRNGCVRKMPAKQTHSTISRMSLIDLAEGAAEKFPGRTAVVQGDHRIQYRELLEIARAAAADLSRAGIRAGDWVGLRFPNSIAYIVLTYALWKCGAVVVPMGMELTATECDTLIKRLGPQAVIQDHAAPDAQGLSFAGIDASCYLRKFIESREPSAAIDDLAFIRFTSGTTGTYKGVALRHRTIAERIRALNRVLRITEQDVIIWTLSMAHHFVSTIALYLAEGACIVLTDSMPAGTILSAAVRENATVLYAAPFHYAQLAGSPSQETMPCLRMALSTTIALPEAVAIQFFKRFGVPVMQAYGIIELGLVSVNTLSSMEKTGSVGRPVPGYTVEIRNPIQPPDTVRPCGDIFVKGPGFFDAYISPLRMAETVLDGGWFDTGDIGWQDDDGFVYLLGRRKDMINIAGMKVFPQEVEAVIDAYPAVKESRVYGLRDARFGERVAADIVAHGADVTENAIRAHCRKRIAAYKVPDVIRFVDVIEKTAVTAKILRRKAKDESVLG